MNQPPLNPDALEKASREVFREVLGFDKSQSTRVARRAISAYLAVAQPKLTPGELVETRAGLALANNAFQEGLGDGIRACNKAVDGEPFVKPVSPYSAPLLAMIKADRPEVKP